MGSCTSSVESEDYGIRMEQTLTFDKDKIVDAISDRVHKKIKSAEQKEMIDASIIQISKEWHEMKKENVE